MTQKTAHAPAGKTTPVVDTRNMKIRVLTALVFAVFFLSLLFFGGGPTRLGETDLGDGKIWGQWVYLALMGFAIFAAIRELVLMARARGYNPNLPGAVATGWLILLHFHFVRSGSDPLPLWAVLFAGMLLIHFGALFFDEKLEEALPSQAIAWMAALAVGLGLGIQQKLFLLEGTLPKTGSRLILALYIITWFGDSTAYFVGSYFGKHKLAPKVSPKKSWEGALGNTLGNIAGAALMRAFVCTEWTWVDVLSLGLLLGIVGQLGDLVESSWKRSAGVKDSNVGVSIPGHGGMLDRVDSLLFAAPALYAYLRFAQGWTQ